MIIFCSSRLNFDALNNVKMSAATISDEEDSWDEDSWDEDSWDEDSLGVGSWNSDEEDDDEDLNYGNVLPVNNVMPDSIDVKTGLIIDNSNDSNNTTYTAREDDIILSKCASIIMMFQFEEPAIMVNIALLIYELYLNTRWDWSKLSGNNLISLRTIAELDLNTRRDWAKLSGNTLISLRTIAELDLNTRWDWAKLTEDPIMTFPTTDDNDGLR